MQHKIDVNSLLRKIVGAFPPPDFLSMPAAAIDISDTSVKYFDVEYIDAGFVPRNFDSIPLKEGVVVDGIVHDIHAMSEVLAMFKKRYKRSFVVASLPEELVYLFTSHMPLSNDIDMTRMVEFGLTEHVPISPKDAVFDYEILSKRDNYIDVSVTVYEKSVVEGYIDSLELAGFEVKSLELESRSVVRSVVPRNSKGVSMVCNFGRDRTGIAITRGQSPIFTTTVHIGGEEINKAIMQQAQVSKEEASIIKSSVGLTQQEDKKIQNVITETVSKLVDEIERHYKFWDRRRDKHGERVDRIENIYICGGAAALLGLPEYIAGKLHVPVKIANVWQSMFNENEYIPQITKTQSLQYATATGLILKDVL